MVSAGFLVACSCLQQKLEVALRGLKPGEIFPAGRTGDIAVFIAATEIILSLRILFRTLLLAQDSFQCAANIGRLIEDFLGQSFQLLAAYRPWLPILFGRFFYEFGIGEDPGIGIAQRFDSIGRSARRGWPRGWGWR